MCGMPWREGGRQRSLGLQLRPEARQFQRSQGLWQGDVNKKITDSVTKGKNQMVPVNLKPDEIKAVTEYIKKTLVK